MRYTQTEFKVWNDLCNEFGEQTMLLYTNGWGIGAISDYMNDGTINDFILSLY